MPTGNPYAFHVRPDMRQGLASEVPLPMRLVSNEEFPPLPQTAAQRRVADRILAEAARLATPPARAGGWPRRCWP